MTSVFSVSKIPVLLSRMSDTCAKPMGLRFSVPPKMTSSILPPRSVFVRCSPMTHRMASDMFDLPLPFGPTIAVISWSKFRRVLSGKDLKPWISNAFKYTKSLAYPASARAETPLISQIKVIQSRVYRQKCHFATAGAHFFRCEKMQPPAFSQAAACRYCGICSSAHRAADCSASFFVRPVPRPISLPLSSTAMVNVLLWSGPLSAQTV